MFEKGTIIKQKNNFISENYILKVFLRNDKFLYTFVGSISEIEQYLRKNHNMILSENVLLSKILLKDLIKYKIEKKDFIYL